MGGLGCAHEKRAGASGRLRPERVLSEDEQGEPMPKPRSVLLVDDEALFLATMAKVLGRHGLGCIPPPAAKMPSKSSKRWIPMPSCST